jgi:hypothetical protein
MGCGNQRRFRRHAEGRRGGPHHGPQPDHPLEGDPRASAPCVRGRARAAESQMFATPAAPRPGPSSRCQRRGGGAGYPRAGRASCARALGEKLHLKHHDPIARRRHLIPELSSCNAEEKELTWHERRFEFRTSLVQRYRKVAERRFELHLPMLGVAHVSLMSRTLRPRNSAADRSLGAAVDRSPARNHVTNPNGDLRVLTAPAYGAGSGGLRVGTGDGYSLLVIGRRRYACVRVRARRNGRR